MERRGLKERVLGALRATLRRTPCSAASKGLQEIAYEPSFVSIPPPPEKLFSLLEMAEELRRAEKRLARRRKTKIKTKKMKLLNNGYGFTSSSSCREDEDDDGDDDGGDLFSSDDGAGTLLSSRSFSSDSSDFDYYSRPLSSKRRRKKKKIVRRKLVRMRSSRWGENELSVSSSSPISGGFVETGFAVEKSSSDPREDFRCSMLEMIMEQQIFGEAEMEGLLRSYLSLNPPLHHRTIIEVFSEIRDTLFGATFLS